MSHGSRAQLEAFEIALAAGKTPEEAARVAAYPDAGRKTKDGRSVFDANARKRARRKDVMANVAKLRAPGLAEAQKEIDVSVKGQLTRLFNIVSKNIEPDEINVMAMIAAERLIAQITGNLAPEKLDAAIGDVGLAERIEEAFKRIAAYRTGRELPERST